MIPAAPPRQYILSNEASISETSQIMIGDDSHPILQMARHVSSQQSATSYIIVKTTAVIIIHNINETAANSPLTN